ncbi:hypothetical protein BDZ90DRAFT_278133 [Jaminaea rosea]|uniref:SAP domain-containing protein n=1 Tax=Jaminaea rosea TaxID=1569628 RepID=A0A316UTS7_9BASI|nr:hypothetical protein BDZ90DRAFT_278133 [Jaminaea rosea]PWN28697.1 hypothetical protein BDZ90DRAFT_278133 [Jaminaea rosea]
MRELPGDLDSLKRPALLQLCKRFGVKAVGKNADLVEKLRDCEAGEMEVDERGGEEGEDDEMDVSHCQGEWMPAAEREAGEGMQMEMEIRTMSGGIEQGSAMGEEEASLLENRASSSTAREKADQHEDQHENQDNDSPLPLPGAYFATPPRPLIKRARSSTPAATSKPSALGHLPSTSSKIAQPLPFATPKAQRCIAPLPRKSTATTTRAHAQPRPSSGLYPPLPVALPPPTPGVRPQETSIWLSPVKPVPAASPLKTATATMGTGASTSSASASAFTFTCPAPTSQTNAASADTDAKSLLLSRLNERLTTAGAEAISSFEPTMKPSASSPARLFALSRTQTQTERRFKSLHQKEMSRSGSIKDHWSLARKVRGGEQKESQHKRVKIAPSPSSSTSTGPAPQTQAPASSHSATSSSSSSSARPEPRINSHARLPAAKQRKARSSLHVAPNAGLGRRKSLVGSLKARGAGIGVGVGLARAKTVRPGEGGGHEAAAPTKKPATDATSTFTAAGRAEQPIRRFFTAEGKSVKSAPTAPAPAAGGSRTAGPGPRPGHTLQPSLKKQNAGPSTTSFRSTSSSSSSSAKPPQPQSHPSALNRTIATANAHRNPTQGQPQAQAAHRVQEARRRAAEESRARARQERARAADAGKNAGRTASGASATSGSTSRTSVVAQPLLA